MSRYLPGNPIGRVHGQLRKSGDTWVVPMYHPAAALHQGSLRRTIEEDFRRIPGYLEQAKREIAQRRPPASSAPTPEAKPQPRLEQMKLL